MSKQNFTWQRCIFLFPIQKNIMRTLLVEQAVKELKTTKKNEKPMETLQRLHDASTFLVKVGKVAIQTEKYKGLYLTEKETLTAFSQAMIDVLQQIRSENHLF